MYNYQPGTYYSKLMKRRKVHVLHKFFKSDLHNGSKLKGNSCIATYIFTVYGMCGWF